MYHRGMWAALAVALGLAAVVSGCGSSSSSSAKPVSASGDTSWAGSAANARALVSLYNAATKAGQKQVVLYGPYAELYRPIWEDFHRRFPQLTVVGKVLPGSGTVASLAAEVHSNRHVGDIVMQGLEGVAVPADQGLLQPYRPPTIKGLPKEYRDPQNRFVVQFGDVFGTLYNTKAMREGDLPTSLDSLTDPKYKGMVIDDPATSQVTTFSLVPIFSGDKLTQEFLRGLKANAKVVQSSTPYYNQVVTGQVKLMPWASHQRYLRLKQSGASVGFKAVPGMSSLVLGGTGIIKGAPDMEAAKLFQAWFLTPEAQNDLVTKGLSVGLMPDTKFPSDWPDYRALYEAEPQVPPQKFDETLQRFLAFIKPVFS